MACGTIRLMISLRASRPSASPPQPSHRRVTKQSQHQQVSLRRLSANQRPPRSQRASRKPPRLRRRRASRRPRARLTSSSCAPCVRRSASASSCRPLAARSMRRSGRSSPDCRSSALSSKRCSSRRTPDRHLAQSDDVDSEYTYLLLSYSRYYEFLQNSPQE
jgi:hypothetical protein